MEFLCCFLSGSGFHKIIKQLFQVIGNSQVCRLQEHEFQGFQIFTFQFSFMCKKELPASFKVFSFAWGHILLHPLPDIFQGPGNIADDMKFINDDRCVGEISTCQLLIDFVHVRDKICHFLFVWERLQIHQQIRLGTGREDIKKTVAFGIREDSLEFLAAGIATEFINGKDAGKAFRLWIANVLQPAEDKGIREPEKGGNGADRLAAGQEMNRIKGQAGGDAAVLGQKGERFIKVFAARRAMIAAFTVMEERFFAHEGEVTDNGDPVIMDLIGKTGAGGTGSGFSAEGERDMDFRIRRRDIL